MSIACSSSTRWTWTRTWCRRSSCTRARPSSSPRGRPSDISSNSSPSTRCFHKYRHSTDLGTNELLWSLRKLKYVTGNWGNQAFPEMPRLFRKFRNCLVNCRNSRHFRKCLSNYRKKTNCFIGDRDGGQGVDICKTSASYMWH